MSKTPRNAAANRAVEFVNNLTCTGDFQGKPFKLRKWQENFVRQLFGTLKKDGRRQYRQAFLFLPRRQGKSSLAAAIALYCLIGLGSPGQQILICAADRKQASHIFDIMASMIEAEPFLKSLVSIVRTTKRIAYPAKNSFVEALSADAPSKRGYNPSVLIFDELLAQQSRDLWNVLTSATSSRAEPLTIAISTAGDTRTSLCYDEFVYAQRVAADPKLDATYLPVIFQAGDDEPWDDEATWRKSNPALEDYQNIEDLRAKAGKAKELPYLERVFRQEHLNQWVDCSDNPWLPVDRWNECQGELPDDLIGGVGGLDLSTTTDLTAFSICFRREGKMYLKAWGWIPKESAREREQRDHVLYLDWIRQGWLRETQGSAVDYEQLRRDIVELCDQYKVKRILCDRWNSTATVQQLRAIGLDVLGIGQGMSQNGLSPWIKEFERCVLSKELVHDGSPALAWCVSNVELVMDDAENVKLSKRRSVERIDLAASSVMSLAGLMSEEYTSVYETGSLFV